ncbi:MAG: leucine-rich repeat protein [Lentihominibacter sp.]
MKHKKRKLLAIITAVLMLFTVYMVPAESASADDGEFSFDASTGTITKYNSDAAEVTIPAEINGAAVKAIGNNAFYDCNAITSVIIPQGVTSIGNNAFRDCDNLADVSIPNSITSIGYMAFYSCDIATVEIPQYVETIGNEAFGCCSNLVSITVDDANNSYSSENGVLYNKDKTVLVQYPIAKASQSFTIPNTVKIIGYGAFYKSSKLKSIWLPNSLESIADRAFGVCDSLTGITIPNGVTTIGDEAFTSCSKLLTVAIPDSVTSIGDSAFKPCKSLVSITVGDDNDNYTSDDGVLYDKKQEALLLYPSANNRASYVIPNGIKTIGDYAFFSCKSLTSVTIPDGVTSIGKNAFTSCKGLTSISIPDSVTSIGDNALSNCTALTRITVGENNEAFSSKDGVLFNKDQTVLILYPGSNNRKSYTIPNGVKAIMEGAFTSCEFLTGILIPDSVTSIDSDSFPWMETLTLFANKGSYAEQTLKQWYPFKEIISVAPGKVSANLNKYHDTLKVSWSKVDGADGYYVYYKKSTWSKPVLLGTTTALSYSKSKLADGAKYSFTIYPYMNIGDQKYMTENSKSSSYVYTLKKLNKPGVKKSSRSYVRVSWNNIVGESGYQIAKSKYSNKKFKIVKRVSKNCKSAKIKTPRYKKYYYKVRAYKTVNGKRIYGPWSTAKSYRLI